jgi:CheY-like chemotaxis protein
MIINDLLKDRTPDEATRNLLSMTQTSAKRGADIIKQLLTFSRGHEGGRMKVQVRHIVTELTSMLTETFPRDIDLQANIPKDLWPVRADPSQLHQVLMNLCVNARDAMPNGGHLTICGANVTKVEGDLALPPDLKSGPYISVEIQDTGLGIPEEIRHRIFEPFFTTKELGKGTGLGLSTVFGIVKSHGGYVELVSSTKHGTTFRVNLPAIPDQTQSIAEAPVVGKASIGTGQTVMVVDDEPFIRDSLRMALEQELFHVLTAPNGEEALKQYLRHQSEISVVITDLMMPVMNGAELIQGLRSVNPSLMIIAMSGVGDTFKGQELKELGIPDVLLKPFTSTMLLSTVANRLKKL